MGGDAMRASVAAHVASFDMADDETMSGLLERYAEVAQSTEALIMSLPSLEVAHPLPDAPWFEPGAWSAPARPAAPHRRDRPARRPCRHHPGVDRRRQVHGLSVARSPASAVPAYELQMIAWGSV